MIMKNGKRVRFIYKNGKRIDKIIRHGKVYFEQGFVKEQTSTILPITFGGVGKNLKDYKVYGNTVQSKLPSDYTQVNYIESSDTQYINTNIVPTNTTKVEIKYQIKIVQNTYVSVFGSRDNNVNFFINNGGGNTITYYWHGTGSTIARIGNFSQTTFNISTMDALNGLVKNYNNETEEELSETVSFTSFPNLPMYIFARNNDGMPSYATLGMKCWYMKIYDNNVLVRDFIPCYRNSDNEVGLYDLVNNVFYTNQGTGTFTYGSVAPTPDTPIEMASCGDRTKNLFDKNSIDDNKWLAQDGTLETANQYVVSDFIPVLENTQYYLPMIDTKRLKYYGSNKQPLSITSWDISSGATEQVITIPINAKYVRFSIHKTVIDINTFQFEKGNAATPYEPYGYKIPVNVRSENLFDLEYELEIQYATNGKVIANYYSLNNDVVSISRSNAQWGRYFFNKITLDAGTYTLSFIPRLSGSDKRINRSVRNLDTQQDIVVNERLSINDGETQSFTFTLNSKQSISFALQPSTNDSGTLNLTNIQLVKSSITPSKYIPHYNKTTNIYLDEPLRKIDGYSDYINFTNGKIVRNIKKIVLDGSEDWYTSSGTSQVAFNKGISYIHDTTKLPCNISNNCQMPNNNLYFYNTGYSLADWKTFLSTTNAIVYGRLSTPTEEDIELPSIPIVDGDNILNIETEIAPSQVYIKYRSDN